MSISSLPFFSVDEHENIPCRRPSRGILLSSPHFVLSHHHPMIQSSFISTPQKVPQSFPRLYPIGSLTFDRIETQRSRLNQPWAIVDCLFTNGSPPIARRPRRNNRTSGGSDASNGTTRSTAPLAAYPQIPIYTPVDRLDLGDHDAALFTTWTAYITLHFQRCL